MPNPIMKYFEYAHLPEHLQAVSKPFGDMAMTPKQARALAAGIVAAADNAEAGE